MALQASIATASAASRQSVPGRWGAPLLRAPVVRVRATTLPSNIRKVSPVGRRVLIQVEEPEVKTAGGVLLPSSAQKKPTKGYIVDAGNASIVQKGNSVVYSKYAGTEILVQDAHHIILKEEDVVGVLEGEDVSAMQPLQDRLLVRVAEAADQTAGGVYLTEASKDQPTLGVVVAAGPGKSLEEEEGSSAPASVGKGRKKATPAPMTAVGKTVLYQRYSGTEFTGADDRKYIVIRNPDVLAVVQ